MKISIFSDKFSGTLSATQVIEIINKVFNENLIQASYFPVTDGGEDSSIIFKGSKIFTLAPKNVSAPEEIIFEFISETACLCGGWEE